MMNMSNNLIHTRKFICMGLVVLGLVLPGALLANNEVDLAPNTQGAYELSLYKSGIIRIDVPVKRISIANPGIVDLLIFKSNQLYAVGKSLGSTNVVLWGKNDQVYKSFDIEVTHDLSTLKNKLHELLPGEKIKVHSAQERIVLSGSVASLTSVDSAVKIAESFLPECITPVSNVQDSTPDSSGKSVTLNQLSRKGAKTDEDLCDKGEVVNLLSVSGAQQVMLEVKVAEISRQLLRSMDTDFNIINSGDTVIGSVSGGATFPNALPPTPLFSGEGSPIGPLTDLFEPNTPSITDTGVFLSHLSGDTFFQAVIDISRQKGLAKILAEPTVTTLSGQEATFISGGEFPVPVPDDDNVTIEFKEFGVGVKFLPTVMNADNINLKMNIEVSELASQNAAILGVSNSPSTFLIPSLTKRGATSTVELRNGQTIGIAGLISDNLRESVDAMPGLGDVPILGTLFRSQDFISGQTELVIFVTPHLAKPIAKEDMRLPTDKFVAPSDYDFYIMGKLEGKEEESSSPLSSASVIPSASQDVKQFGHNF